MIGCLTKIEVHHHHCHRHHHDYRHRLPPFLWLGRTNTVQLSNIPIFLYCVWVCSLRRTGSLMWNKGEEVVCLILGVVREIKEAVSSRYVCTVGRVCTMQCNYQQSHCLQVFRLKVSSIFVIFDLFRCWVFGLLHFFASESCGTAGL